MPRARPYGRKDKPPPSTDISAFQEALRSAKNIVAVTGAGLSAASGIPTFRGAGGFWRNYDAVSLATPEAFAENHSLVWQFYHYRREKALESKPNAAHTALSLFSIPDLRKQVTHPEGTTFHHITQNVDGLAIRSLKSVYATHNLPEPSQSTVDADGHPILIEMHGRLHDLQCNSKRCKHVEFNTTSPICPALAGTELILARPEEANEEKSEVPDAPEIADKDLPRCSKCGGLARPGVVWFGEIPHQLEVIDKIVEKADLCLVVGTSSVVYPAAGYADEISRNGGKVAIFNLEASAGDSDADFLFRGPCEETLIKALGLGQASAVPA